MEKTPSVDVGPWWYALLIASAIAAITLVNSDSEGNSLTTWLGVLTLSLGLILFDARSRTINFGPLAQNKIALAGLIALFILTIAVWSAAIETIGYDTFVPGWMFVGWAATSAMVYGIRTLVLRRAT